MSYTEIEKLSKADLKNKLAQMGMSLDRNDHPWDYYAQLYLEKMNTKNKITRDNTPFYKNKVLKSKRGRERTKEKDKELLEDPNYEEEEYEEEDEIKDDDDEDYLYEEGEEEIDDNNEKEKSRSKRKRRSKNKIEEKYPDYRESGIKITRLIRLKKEKMLKGKKVILENPNVNSNVKRRIFNNYEEMAGRDGEYNNNIYDNDISGDNAVKQNINLSENNNYKNNDYYQYQNYNNVPESKKGVINIRVEKLNDINNQEGRNPSNETNQFNNTFEAITPNKISEENNEKMKVSFGAPKNDKDTHIHLLSNGPVSFGYNQNSTLSKMKDNNNENFGKNKNAQKYDFFLKNLTKSVKNDVKESQRPKRVLLKWDSPRQKEFLCSSMKKGDFGPSDENIDSNNLETVTLEYRYNARNNFEPNDRLFAKPPNKQIVTESIQNTTINQYDGNNMGNNNQNDYKSKLRSYKNNKGQQITNNDYNNDNGNMNNNMENYRSDINNLNNNNEDYKNVNNYDNNMNMNDNNYNMNNNNEDYNNLINYDNNMNMNDNNYNNNMSAKNNNNLNDNIQYSEYNKNIDINNNENPHNNNQISGYSDNNQIYANDINNDNKLYTNSYPMIQKDNMNMNQNDMNGNNNVMLGDMIEYEKENEIEYTNNNNNNNINNNNMYNENTLDNNNNINNDNNMIANDNTYNYSNNNQNQNQNYNMTDNNLQNGEKKSEISTSNKNKFSIGKSAKNLNKKIMAKLRKNIYILPLILLIAFGIVFLYNEKNENWERINIIIVFSILMALLIIYHLIKYIMKLKEYKKMAREDRIKLLEILQTYKITSEEMGNNNVLLSNFIYSQIEYHNIDYEEYANYVFPYLKKYLEKDGFCLEKVNQDKNEYNTSYWKEI